MTNYDRWLTKSPWDEYESLGNCSFCNADIYEDEKIFYVNDEIVCEECIEFVIWKMTSQYKGTGMCAICGEEIEEDHDARELTIDGKTYIFHEDCICSDTLNFFEKIGLIKEATAEKEEPDWDLMCKDESR